MIDETIASGSLAKAGGSAAVSTGTTAAGAPSTILATAKAVLVSPLFGIAVLVGIVAFELWKGGKDAREFSK